MTENEFMIEIERLTSTYGEKNYPRDRVNLIWHRVKWRNTAVFKDAIDFLIMESQYPPMITKILDALSLSQKKFPELTINPDDEIKSKIQEIVDSKCSCKKCLGYGTVMAFRKWSGLSATVFLCDCGASYLAEKLREYRGHRRLEPHDQFYYVYSFDPKSSEKFELYNHLGFERPQDCMDELHSIYYSKEVEMDPDCWRPN